MATRKLSEVVPYKNYNKIETALFVENGLLVLTNNPENPYNDSNFNYNKLFPEKSLEVFSFTNYLEKMPKLINTDKFVEALKNHSKFDEICVFGDYDVDGVKATTIMTHTLSVLGYNVHFSIPDRLRDGYGQQKIKEDVETYDTKLAITVDNGVSAKNFVEEAKELGVKVIVTDHHLPESGNVPDCLIIDPSYNNDEFAGICGAVVALKLCYELVKELDSSKLGIFSYLTPLAGFATVADMMPMLEENRELVLTTLKEFDLSKEQMKNNIRTPFQKIMFALGGDEFYRDDDALATEEIIGFTIGPVINAVSRVSGQVDKLINDILSTLQSPNFRMKSYSDYNETRKKMTKELLSEYKYDKTYKNSSVFVYEEDQYYYSVKGIIGLIANKVSKSKNLVTLIGHRNSKSETIDFSGRSLPGYNLNEGIQRIKENHPEFEITGGGHANALGIKIKNDPIILSEFKKALDEDVANNSVAFEETIWEFEPDMCDEIIDTLVEYQPYGEGWQKPKFYYKGKFVSFNAGIAEIGGYLFKIYASAAAMTPYIGKEVELEFTMSFDSKTQVAFKANLKK